MLVSIINQQLIGLDVFPKDLCNIIAAYGCSIMFNAADLQNWNITSDTATLTKLNNTWTTHYCYSDAISEIPWQLHTFDLKFNSQPQYPNWISIDFEPPFYWNTDNEVRWRSEHFGQASFVVHCKIVKTNCNDNANGNASWTLDMWSSDAVIYDHLNSIKKSIQYINDDCVEPCVKLELFHLGDSVQVTYT